MKLAKSIKSTRTLLIAILSISGILTLAFVATSQAASSHANERAVCPAPPISSVRCHAHIVTDKNGNPAVTVAPTGYGPTQFHTAYNLPATSTSPATIAIVDAYDHPSIKANLDTYDSTFNLPSFPSCSTSVTTSCFTKVNQRGGTSYPSANSGWALEIALDVETAHQTCQNCKLILVEADSSSYPNLMTAVDEARTLGATVISNSYGSSEFSGETTYDSHFNHPGTAFIFSSGDNGYGATYPAASTYVTAVGGTSLTLTSSKTRQTESVWSGAGSGCSAYETKPTFQHDLGCTNRTIADVSADADPNTGAAVYDSVRYQGQKGWFQVGGTSLASPLIAGIYGLAGNLTALTSANSMPYASSSSNLYDITSGSNGTCGTYLCNGVSGFDGPSGLGSPIGSSAF
jgi:subtilase family serine protease